MTTMRATVTIDPTVEETLTRPMNTLPTFDMGQRPGEDLDPALRLASQLEDQEVPRKVASPA
jgi:hypothetical protein